MYVYIYIYPYIHIYIIIIITIIIIIIEIAIPPPGQRHAAPQLRAGQLRQGRLDRSGDQGHGHGPTKWGTFGFVKHIYIYMK